MRIEGSRAPARASAAKSAPRCSAGFGVSEPFDDLPAEAANGPTGSVAIDCLAALAMTEGHGAAHADRVAARQGQALLSALAGVQVASLGDGLMAARRTVADLARALPAASNPGLDGVLQAIAQRAAIELARSE